MDENLNNEDMTTMDDLIDNLGVVSSYIRTDVENPKDLQAYVQSYESLYGKIIEDVRRSDNFQLESAKLDKDAELQNRKLDIEESKIRFETEKLEQENSLQKMRIAIEEEKNRLEAERLIFEKEQNEKANQQTDKASKLEMAGIVVDIAAKVVVPVALLVITGVNHRNEQNRVFQFEESGYNPRSNPAWPGTFSNLKLFKL